MQPPKAYFFTSFSSETKIMKITHSAKAEKSQQNNNNACKKDRWIIMRLLIQFLLQ